MKHFALHSSVLAMFLVAASLFAAVPAKATNAFNSVYNASSGKFPDQVCPPWTLSDTATPEDPVLSGGVLVIVTDQSAEDLVYRFQDNVAIPDPLVIEARMKLVSGSSTHASRAPASIGFTTASSVGNHLFIGVDEVFLAEGDLVKGPTAAVDTNDAFHTYRIEVTAAGVITVFQDGIQILTGATFFSTTFSDPFPNVKFGETSGLASGTSHWEFVRHNASTVNCTDHFLCYEAKTTRGTAKFEPKIVTLKDQFDAEPQRVEVKKPVSLCNPADKNDEGINDPVTHLKGYQIKPETPHVPRTNIKIENQFHPSRSELFVDTIKPDRLLVPTAKDPLDPVPEPDPDSHSVDHYKCYKVKVTPGTAKFPKGIQATVDDQFPDTPKVYDLKKPRRLCTPVDKNGEGLENEAAHLMCYQAKPASGQPKHVPVTGIHVNNQFGPEQLDTIKEEELCVPSVKTPPAP